MSEFPDLVSSERFDHRNYPQVHVAVVHFLGDEVQIEQGTAHGVDVDLKASDNAVISMSKEQALAVARKLIATLEG